MLTMSAKHGQANRAAAPDRYLSPDERRADGKALRDTTPRVAQGGWKPPKDRRDPIELLHESNEGRIPELIPVRFGRMSQSPFAFYRGSAAVMAADLATTQTSGLRVQACGDAHLLNFGGFATPERNIFFDINDFDETLPGNCSPCEGKSGLDGNGDDVSDRLGAGRWIVGVRFRRRILCRRIVLLPIGSGIRW